MKSNREQCENLYDTWVLTDKLGRTAPNTETAGKPNGNEVGMFYFLWHRENGALYDHTKIYREGGKEALWETVPQGPMGYAHYWSEPLFGYYRSADRWVIRKHCHMLAAAGVDFIFFDTSNGLYYPEEVTAVFETFAACKAEGVKVPKIFFFNGDQPALNAHNIPGEYELIYKEGKFRDLWYMVDGKPLMLGNPSAVEDKSILDFFTFRRSWAFDGDWYRETEGRNCWPWADLYPQIKGFGPNAKLEQMIVMAGFWANGSQGRSFHNGAQPTDGKSDFEFGLMDSTTPWGLGFQEQFDYARKINPPRVMVTGWNEWWAGRWEGRAAQGQTIANQWTVNMDSDDIHLRQHYVDNFNTEFSRDIEPMKGGFEDNYYCQLAENVRAYKGVAPLPLSNGRKTIRTTADFADVQPTYYDTLFDTVHRDAGSNGGNLHYVDNSGRNDIDFAKVARDDTYTYFYVQTREPLTAPEGADWMNLFLDVHPGCRQGWEGYSYLLNRTREGNLCSVEKTEGGWNFQKIGDAEITVQGNALTLKVKSELIGLGNVPVTFDFKWADASVTDGDAMDFYTKGDAAPDGRFNFRYSEN